jgi:hypothetical protein
MTGLALSRLGFALSAGLSIALVVSALIRTAPQISAPSPAIARAALDDDFTRQLNDAVQKAVAESEARQTRKIRDSLAAAERRDELEWQGVLEYLKVERKHAENQMNPVSSEGRDSDSASGFLSHKVFSTIGSVSTGPRSRQNWNPARAWWAWSK